ncbi:PTS sugar transporter subunit IIA [Lactobacillus hamsteri]|uniref:PTS EIIA type-4 domain-containing protein n=1 Tax=Lactobacillus hamsteri DSM 5661 = JCM 6256 TaxID=1423754 RepID=A0A0R1YL33_9LACO|nr:PTS sugar transporter subunit IIA [Lactobacillus hamsteri]KRM39932.1 hypothetical protein FC39_GL000933 [Lactobacillus hamsteri DSM 5661 = JCM 6256]
MQIIVTGHGNFATGIESTVKLLAGSIQNVSYIDFTGEMSEDDIAKKFKEQVAKDNQTLFFCDLLGGTPFKQAVMYKANNPTADIEVICGCNVGSLLEVALPGFSNYKVTDDLAKELIKSSKAGIRQFGVKNQSVTELTDGEGI